MHYSNGGDEKNKYIELSMKKKAKIYMFVAAASLSLGRSDNDDYGPWLLLNIHKCSRAIVRSEKVSHVSY